MAELDINKAEELEKNMILVFKLVQLVPYFSNLLLYFLLFLRPITT